jgi:hypothetical protein
MVDMWSNKRNIPIMNFLAYFSRYTIFFKSVDTSDLQKDKEILFKIFPEVVKEVGLENIIKFISDNQSHSMFYSKCITLSFGLFMLPITLI